MHKPIDHTWFGRVGSFKGAGTLRFRRRLGEYADSVLAHNRFNKRIYGSNHDLSYSLEKKNTHQTLC